MLSVDKIYLLFDYVPFIKNIQNLSKTGRTVHLLFFSDGQKLIPDFQHLRDLYLFEAQIFFQNVTIGRSFC